MEETLDPNSSPNKRLKSETLTLETPISPSSAKGKAPIADDVISGDDDDESPADLPPQNCGICFSDEGKSIRGLVDSCDHYFCFLCIIEWSKIESRCPLCRARFSSIRRMRKDGSFIGNGSVTVPVRDQIYDPFGDPVDPYAQAKCNVCSGAHEENLLLLCDLCDSAWHTFCVGLGATVPEGDWYCHDCALLRAEQCDAEMDDSADNSSQLKLVDDVARSPSPSPSTSPSALPSPSPSSLPPRRPSVSVSIFDIVRDPSERERAEPGADRLRNLASPSKKKLSSSVNSGCAGSLQGKSGKSQIYATEYSARTLHKCRNVHRHIRVLRENWDAFRTGSLSFSSKLLDSRKEGSRKRNVAAMCAERFQKSKPVTSTSPLQLKAQEASCNAGSDKQPYNINKAWKLMDKSMHQFGKPSPNPKTACNKGLGIKAGNISSKCVPLRRKDLVPATSRTQIRNEVNERLRQRSGLQFTSIVTEAVGTSSSKCHKSSVSRLSSFGKVQTPVQADIYHLKANFTSRGKLHRCKPTFPDNGGASSSSSCGPVAGSSNLSCTKSQIKEISPCHVEQLGNANNCIAGQADVQTSGRAKICYDRAVLPSKQNLGEGSSNVSDEHKVSACSPSRYDLVTGSSSASCVDLQGEKTFGCPSEVGAKTGIKSSTNDEAKDEIISLVKLNLKLLSKEKRLEADTFKEIARLSTHTILAACGFKHRKIVHSYPTVVCDHGYQVRKSTLMPSLCRECFYQFVKNVVTSIMLEKLNTAGVAC